MREEQEEKEDDLPSPSRIARSGEPLPRANQRNGAPEEAALPSTEPVSCQLSWRDFLKYLPDVSIKNATLRK